MGGPALWGTPPAGGLPPPPARTPAQPRGVFLGEGSPSSLGASWFHGTPGCRFLLRMPVTGPSLPGLQTAQESVRSWQAPATSGEQACLRTHVIPNETDRQTGRAAEQKAEAMRRLRRAGPSASRTQGYLAPPSPNSTPSRKFARRILVPNRGPCSENTRPEQTPLGPSAGPALAPLGNALSLHEP